ncbi:MAG: hypothetical protein CVU40_10090 [Chloroflexi bacterium HGW-Chloroflexi-2]|jgi:glycosyltransferase involved in cell wall biosynthesis|nr:MAG: hypothetical protein CVU40_10090 [Chloroflexi bacterium HGW-Chloroflexi-2]
MKILFICNEYPPAPHGGVGTYVKNIAKNLSDLGHKVYVVGVYSDINNIEELFDGKVKIVRLPTVKGNSIKRNVYVRFNLAKFVEQFSEENKIDIIEIPEGGGFGLFFSNKIPWIIRLHNTAPIYMKSINKQRGFLLSFFENISLFRSTRIVGVSQYILSKSVQLYPLLRYFKRDIKVIYNSIDIVKFQYKSKNYNEHTNITFAGTLKPVKNIMNLIMAFIDLIGSGDFSDVFLHIYGNDSFLNGQSYKENLIKSIPEIYREKIIFHEPVDHDQMNQVFWVSDVCVFPSVYESFGLVAAEAMSCGRPVIYSCTGPGSELIDDGVDGLLCDPYDPGSIKEKIELILKDKEYADKIGENASKKIKKNFSNEIIILQNISLYNEVISNPGKM